MKLKNERIIRGGKSYLAVTFSYIITTILNLVLRRFFVIYLGDLYLGLNSFFSLLLSSFSLLELGFGSAIIFSLYNPFLNKNYSLVKSLLRFYSKVYVIISLVILFLSIIILQFLPVLLAGITLNVEIYIIYILFIVNSLTSYYFVSKKILFFIDQRIYITSLIKFFFTVSIYIFQIFYLLIFQDFIGYLLISIILNLLNNLSTEFYASRRYKNIFLHEISPIPEDLKSSIKKNVYSLIFHRFGGVISSNLGGILVSIYVGVVQLGYYSNYILIVNFLQVVLGNFFTSITPTLGSINVTETTQTKRDIFYKIQFLANFIYGFSSVILFSLLNPFISIWLGKIYVLDNSIVLLIVMVYFINGLRKPSLMLSDAMGLYWFDKFKPLFESAFFLVTAIFFGYLFGIYGILVSSFLTTFLIPFWIEPKNVFKNGLFLDYSIELRKYLFNSLYFFLLSLFIGLIVYLFSLLFISFIYKTVIVIISSTFLYYVFLKKNFYFVYYSKLVVDLVK